LLSVLRKIFLKKLPQKSILCNFCVYIPLNRNFLAFSPFFSVSIGRMYKFVQPFCNKMSKGTCKVCKIIV
jgi:hypothetical protein